MPIVFTFAACCLAGLTTVLAADSGAAPRQPETIKSYCLDFNWAFRDGFAKPGTYHDADPAQQVAWHKAVGSNVIQTFCVSHNGYAWYRNDVTPEQPGLKHDFLREVVKLGHEEGMLVMGYFSIAANKSLHLTPSSYRVWFCCCLQELKLLTASLPFHRGR